VGSEEPLSNREILAKFTEVDKRFDAARDDKKAVDDRITRLAQNTVTNEAWARENGHVQKDIAEVDAHCEERHKIVMEAIGELKKATDKSFGELKKSIEKRSDLTWQRVIGILSILAVLAAAWYTALRQGGH